MRREPLEQLGGESLAVRPLRLPSRRGGPAVDPECETALPCRGLERENDHRRQCYTPRALAFARDLARVVFRR